MMNPPSSSPSSSSHASAHATPATVPISTTTTTTTTTVALQPPSAASVLLLNQAPAKPQSLPCAVVIHNSATTTSQLMCRAHHHFPAHMLALCPFTRPFTFGTDACHTKSGSHVGMAPNADGGDGPVLGTMLGNREFMVLADSTFIILTPSKATLTLHEALLPNSRTHSIQFGRKGQSYPMQPGSVLIAQSDLALRSATVFLADREQYNRLLYQSLQWSLVHFTGIHRRIVLDPQQDRADHPFFSKQANKKPLCLSGEWGVSPIQPGAAHQTDELKRIALVEQEEEDPDAASKRRTSLAAAALLDFSIAAAAQRCEAASQDDEGAAAKRRRA